MIGGKQLMPMKKPLHISHTPLSRPGYVAFTRERDLALERLLNRAHKRQSAILSQAIAEMDRLLTIYWPSIERTGFFLSTARKDFDQLIHLIEAAFRLTVNPLAGEFVNLQHITYKLTRVSQAEALARAGVKTARLIPAVLSHGPEGSPDQVHARVELSVLTLVERIKKALRGARIGELGLHDTRVRVSRVLPKVTRVARPKNTLLDPKRMMTESDSSEIKAGSTKILTGLLDRDEWQDIVDSVSGPDVYPFRNEDTVFDTPNPNASGEEYFTWEAERDTTHEFVQQVRDGKNQAANDAGIQDFVWIAVVDKATDDCCMWRDGLTTSQIEEELKGAHSDDECDAITPPAHPNCRCDIEPVTSDLTDEVNPAIPEFDTWLRMSF